MLVILSLKVTIVAGFTLEHPDFDPLGVVDLENLLDINL
jgi:hypothetical protein